MSRLGGGLEAAESTLRALLERHGVPARKGLGQHFLISKPVVQRIVERISGSAGVFEIGPGPGVLTSLMSETVDRVLALEVDGRPRTRISIFLSVFDVHVNRSPIGGVIRDVQYRKGLFKNALGAVSAECNEQNIVTVDDGAQTVVFKQIAGLIARRIIFTKRVGDTVARGERIGMIKFGSRCDVIFDAAATVQVKIGQHVAGGSSILAVAPVPQPAEPRREPSGAEREQGARR